MLDCLKDVQQNRSSQGQPIPVDPFINMPFMTING